MSDDIQRESERIHKGIIESLSFSEALAKRDEEIERLRDLLQQAVSARWPPPPEWYEAAQKALGDHRES